MTMSQSTVTIGMRCHQEEVEEVTLYWTIPDFKELYNANKADNKHFIGEEEQPITAGGRQWRFLLFQYNEEDVRVTLYYSGTTGWAFAKYSVYVKSSEDQFVNTLNRGLEKYAHHESNIKGAVYASGIDSRDRWMSLSSLQDGGFLTNGTLSLKLVLSVYTGKAALQAQLSADLQKGLDTGAGSDVTFVFVEEEGSRNVIGEIPAHRTILSLRSPVFAIMLGSGMTEVRISDISPKAMRMLLKFVYSAEVDPEWRSVANELIYGAEKYGLGDLREYLCANVEPVLTLRNVMKIRDLATRYDLPDVLKCTLEFIQQNTAGFLDNHDFVFKRIV